MAETTALAFEVNFTRLGDLLIEEIGEVGLKIILMLGRQEKMVMLELKRSGLSYSSIYRMLPILEKYGLIKEEREGIKRFFSLTEKGQLFYKKLLELEDLLAK